jgi:hypothetical protein
MFPKSVTDYRCPSALVLLLASIFGAALGPLPARGSERTEEGDDASRFVRVLRSDDGEPLGLQTSIVRYVPTDESNPGVTVDLIGAVHVADRDYYEELNRRFSSYDAVLYELVAPEGTRVPRGGGKRGRHPVSSLQGVMKSMLELDFQLDHIDYTKKNLVHADMSPDEFARSMKERGESFLQILFRMMGHAMAKQSSDTSDATDLKLLAALFAPDRARQLKRTMAEQFEEMEGIMAAFGGPEGSTLITERNKKALGVLTEQMQAGKRRLGIFYGAGHMADMEKRLVDDFRMRRLHQDWLTAWDLRGDRPADESGRRSDRPSDRPVRPPRNRKLGTP